MSISDILQLISIICTSILSIVAIIISILTLLQNNKIIFESNKPYITMFSKVINFTSPHGYLIIKNFGKTGATILDIKYDNNLINKIFPKNPFENISNTFIAPEQSFLYPIKLNNSNKSEDFDTILNFEIKYKYLNKEYVEKHSVTFNQFKGICFLKNHSSKDIKELSEVLQEMTIQNL